WNSRFAGTLACLAKRHRNGAAPGSAAQGLDPRISSAAQDSALLPPDTVQTQISATCSASPCPHFIPNFPRDVFAQGAGNGPRRNRKIKTGRAWGRAAWCAKSSGEEGKLSPVRAA